MSRRRRRIRNRRGQKKPNKWLILVQLVVAVAVLVFLLGFGDYLAKSASNVVSGVAGSDLDVKKKKGEQAKEKPEQRPKLEAPAQPTVEIQKKDEREQKESTAGTP